MLNGTPFPWNSGVFLTRTSGEKAVGMLTPLSAATPLQMITGIKAEDGREEERIRIEWKDPNQCRHYFVYRATGKTGPYEKIAQTGDPRHLDTDAEPGLKYWYKVQGYRDGGYTPLSGPESGYRKMPVPKGMDMDEIISRKKATPVYPTAEERAKAERFGKVLSPYYKNSVKLSFIILVAKYYVRRGDLKVLGDFYHYSLNRKYGSVFLIGKNAGFTYTVRLENSRFVRIASNWDRTLLDRLMENAYFYCIYGGDRELTGKNGNTYMVPHFEAVGFTSEYFKNDRNWKTRTVMFDSDNAELDAMINRAGRWKTGN